MQLSRGGGGGGGDSENDLRGLKAEQQLAERGWGAIERK